MRYIVEVRQDQVLNSNFYNNISCIYERTVNAQMTYFEMMQCYNQRLLNLGQLLAVL